MKFSSKEDAIELVSYADDIQMEPIQKGAKVPFQSARNNDESKDMKYEENHTTRVVSIEKKQEIIVQMDVKNDNNRQEIEKQQNSGNDIINHNDKKFENNENENTSCDENSNGKVKVSSHDQVIVNNNNSNNNGSKDDDGDSSFGDSSNELLIKFYHGSFEFFAPYSEKILSPVISQEEYDALLRHINIVLSGNLPKKKKTIRLLTIISIFLLLLGIGIILVIIPLCLAYKYERDFKKYLELVSQYCTQLNLIYLLVKSPLHAPDLEKHEKKMNIQFVLMDLNEHIPLDLTNVKKIKNIYHIGILVRIVEEPAILPVPSKPPLLLEEMNSISNPSISSSVKVANV